MANGYEKAAFESIPGNETNSPVLSTKVIYEPLNEFDVDPKPSHLERDDELRNVDEPISVLSEAYDPEWSLEQRAYPDSLAFELKGIFGNPVTTPGDGIITDPDAVPIPATATRHVWTAPYGPSGASPLTTERIAAYKDESTFFKLKGCGTQQLALESPEKGGVKLKASGPALHLARISDPALTPAYESLSIAPFERGHCTIQTQLGGSAVTEDFNVEVENPMDTVRSLGIASKFPDVLEKGDGPIVVSGSIPKRHIDPDDFDALMAATGFALKVRWQSTVNIAATSYKYTLWLECLNAQYMTGKPQALANKRRLGATFDWKATYAGVAGSTKWTLVNNTASYA